VRTLAAIAALALVLTGCGSGDGAEDVLADTASQLGDIRSGTLDARLVVTPRSGDPFGFELHGPFAFGKSGSLPVMDVQYTQIANGERATVTLISTGEKAYARVGDELTELSAQQAGLLRSAAGALEGRGGLERLPIGDWITDAEVSEDGDVEVVRGKLDVVAAANGLIDLARGFGRDVPRVEGDAADQLRESTRSTLFELRTGKDDRLLRRLRLEADFGLEVPEQLRSALGELVGAKIEFRLGVDRPNAPVKVADPSR
jgi:hypothetical protein